MPGVGDVEVEGEARRGLGLVGGELGVDLRREGQFGAAAHPRRGGEYSTQRSGCCQERALIKEVSVPVQAARRQEEGLLGDAHRAGGPARGDAALAAVGVVVGEAGLPHRVSVPR